MPIPTIPIPIPAILLAWLLALASAANAQGYPAKPVRLLVGFPPGGAADFVARAIAEPLGRELGQPLVIENRPGAGSSIAAELAARAAPDGYTILIASPSSIMVNPLLMPKLGYNAKTDLAPITQVSASPMVVAANPTTGIASLRELIDAAKKAPGKLNFASAGNGSAPHLAGVLFLRVAGVDIVHVPFKGGGPAVASVLAGDTQVTFATPPSVLPQIEAGRLRGLAVTSRKGSPLFPNLPGTEAAGLPEYEISFWYGFFAPAGTPAPIVKRIFDATTMVLRKAEVEQMLAREGTEAVGSASPEAFAAFLADEEKLWARIVKDSGAKLD
jgi:tripartite-type tricarboxylate transporter receptor subunit TctC